ncbi:MULTISPECIES: LuxR C-terminal-related transcriptional regulator [unclassified Leifsonia]|uniref:LuxR C-terminal-related transcriptional regulator n=1 Tax=unclassified Leifsonia TaxID=2663824 RepID=UPI00037FC9F1|nr:MULTISPECIES: LuxR C-terminal-related transcriptional regulator [unclassified Leifsonia]TDP99557.1 LuxR family maltose regulon positive regulatory protein [Leifsonia sp. 115AMFTsu3.1]
MGSANDDLETLLFESKTTAPLFDPAYVRRQDLIQSLRASTSRIVTVEAPAGYGKTSLLAEWEHDEDRATGWLTLREDDDDPAALIRLLARVCTAFASEAESVFTQIATTQTGVLSRLAPALALALSRCERPFVLFIDDVHVLRTVGCIDALEVALARVPAGSQVVLASRQHLAALARGRVEMSAARVGAAELRIDLEGAARIADEAGAHVDQSILEDWVERCEGWAAGLHMYALLSRSRPFAVTSDHSALADYLYRECVRDLPEDTRQFLIRTSILSTHIPDLCDAVLERDDSIRILRDLESRQLFVTADVDGRAFRLHPLFREYLSDELQLESASLVPALHARASQWFAERGQLPAAIDHAIAAGDFPTATALVTAAGLPAYEAGQSGTLGRWLREIGDANLLANPSAVVVFAWFAVLAGSDDDARKWGTLLGMVPDDAAAAGINVASAKAMIRAIMMRDGIESALEDAEFAAEVEPLESPWRDPAVQILGSTLLHAGYEERARIVLGEAIHIASVHGNPASIVICESELAFLAIEAGGWEQAAPHIQRALDTIRAGGIEGYVMSAYAHASAACLELHAGRTLSGRRYLARAMSERQRCGSAVPLLSIPTRLLLVRAQLAVGDADAARILLDEIDEVLPPGLPGDALDTRRAFARNLLAEHTRTRERRADSVALTEAEQRVLPYLQTHLTRPEIAQRLYVSPNTVKTHISAIFQKFGVSSRSEAVRRGVELELLGKATELTPV